MAAIPNARRTRWPRVAGIVLGSLVVLYFLLTSGFFLRAVVLPRVSSAAGITIEAGDVSLSPFSSVEIRNLTATVPGETTLAKVDLVRARYSLLSILGGDIAVSEVTVENPVVTLVAKADGSSNLPKSEGTAAPKPSAAAGKPPKLDIRNVAIRNATFRSTAAGTNGTQVSEVAGFNLAVDRIANGASGKITLSANLGVQLPDRSELTATLEGAIDAAIDAAALPASLKGGLALQVSKATGGLKDLAGLRTQVDLDATASELRRFGVSFLQGGQSFADIRLDGPVDISKKEARIHYVIGGIDRRIVRLAAPALPYDLGRTVVSAEGRVDLGQAGTLVTSQGRLGVSDLTLGTPQGTTPALQASIDYKVGVDLAEKTAVVDKVDLGVKQAGRSLVTGTLDRPMNLSWGNTGKGFRDSTYTLQVDGFRLQEWTAVIGTSAPSATVSSTLALRSDRDGRDLKASLRAAVDDVVARIGEQEVRGVAARLELDAVVLEFADFGVSRLVLGLSQSGSDLVSINGTLNHSLARNETGGQFSLQADLPRLAAILPVAGFSAKSGEVKVAVAASLKPGATNVSANLNLAGFTGSLQGMEFHDYQASFGSVLDVVGSTLSIQKLSLAAQTGFESGGGVDLSGRVDLVRGGGEIGFKVVNLNESALAPFLDPSLRPNRLRSVSVDGGGSVKFSAGMDAEVASDIRITRLVAEDPAGRLPKTPLELGLNLEAARKSGVLELGGLKLDLGKTTNAANQLRIAGRIDPAPTNATPSRISIRSDGLDLTPLYAIFAGSGTATNAPAPAARKAPAAAAQPPVEPAPVALPFRRFDLDLDIQRVLLGEIDLRGWKAALAIEDGTVSLNPFKLTLNGAPVDLRAKADLSVPGYRYDLGLKLDSVPLEPIVNTFQPARRGLVHGTVVADSAIRGAGITGASLARNLDGKVAFAATNLNLSLENVTSSWLKPIVSVVTSIPALIKNPTGQLGNLLGRAIGRTAAGNDPWAEELQAKPIDFVTVDVALGGGGAQIRTATVQSAAFRADASGGVRFAPVLDDSPVDVPVLVALQRQLAEKAVLLDASVPADAAYAPLPRFVTLKGTVGAVQADINYTVVGAMSAKAVGRAVGGLGSNVGNKVGGVLGVLGNALGGGGGAAATNAPAKATNAPANPVGDLLRGLGKPRN